jgi:hypothetical protein
VSAVTAHDWRLVAPWWGWPRGDDPDERVAVRTLAPILQMYDSPGLVNVFLADPQHRLAYRQDSDEVHLVCAGGAGDFPSRRSTGRRKLYLAAHHRHYLVVCSLHCDVPGFPHARRADVCESGFVVRRRHEDLPAETTAGLSRALRRYNLARRRRETAQQQLGALPPARRRATTLDARIRTLAGAEEQARAELADLAGRAAGSRQLQGWVTAAGRGEWQPVAETPDELTEATFPLTPLIAPPADESHDAHGETILFGLVPSGGSDLDAQGRPRFDDDGIYEIRCYVRRHRALCPRDGSHAGCPVTWSEPSEAYQLAAHSDLEGTAHRPVTVTMPDLTQLRADAVRLGPGGAGGARFRSPPGSELAFTTDDLTATEAPPEPGSAGAQTCTYAIPLLTIVAMFVFKLFLPIVLFVFQLWFLLQLRFCFPPDVRIDSGTAAKFAALGDGLDVDATVAADIAVDPQVRTALDALLGKTRAGSVSLAQKLQQALADEEIDPRTYAVLARSALAKEPATVAPAAFVARVERFEVVRP